MTKLVSLFLMAAFLVSCANEVPDPKTAKATNDDPHVYKVLALNCAETNTHFDVVLENELGSQAAHKVTYKESKMQATEGTFTPFKNVKEKGVPQAPEEEQKAYYESASAPETVVEFVHLTSKFWITINESRVNRVVLTHKEGRVTYEPNARDSHSLKLKARFEEMVPALAKAHTCCVMSGAAKTTCLSQYNK